MHELHLITNAISDLKKRANDANTNRVTKIYFRMGEFTEISADSLKFHFTEQSKGTILEGAELVIEKSPVRELVLVSFDCE